MLSRRESGNRGSLSSKIETAANIATLLVAVLFSMVLVKTYLLPAPSPNPLAVRATESVRDGTSLNNRLPGVNWSKNGQTVVLVLSTQCHFCTESAPFLRKLSEKSGRRFKIVAVLPQPVIEARDYLTREGVSVDQLSQMPIDKVGVEGTPTMLLLDKSGIVTKSWVGKLNPEEQSQALKAIGAAT